MRSTVPAGQAVLPVGQAVPDKRYEPAPLPVGQAVPDRRHEPAPLPVGQAVPDERHEPALLPVGQAVPDRRYESAPHVRHSLTYGLSSNRRALRRRGVSLMEVLISVFAEPSRSCGEMSRMHPPPHR